MRVFGKLLFSVTSIFLLGYYIPLRVAYPFWIILFGSGILATIIGFRKSGILLLCTASLFAGLYHNYNRLHSLPDYQPDMNRGGVWKLAVETTTTRGALLSAESGEHLWSSDRDLASALTRGDSVIVIGNIRGNFIDIYSFRVSQSQSPQDRIRRAVCMKWRERLPSRETNSLVSALLAGERGSIPEIVRDTFEMTGASHLLAVSGLHVGIITAMILLTARYITGKTWFSVLITILLMGCYVLLAGARPSTVRAGIMAIFVLTAFQATGRTPDLLFVWSAAVIALIILSNGTVLDDIGAQMSFGAVLSLILFGVRFRMKYGKALSTFYAGFVVTLSLAPLVSTTYGAVSFMAPLATVLSLPFMLVLMALGVISLSWGPFAAGASRLAEWVVFIWLELLHILEFKRIEFESWMLYIWFVSLMMLWFFSRRRGFHRRFR